jgi:hypothetical protein
MDEDKVTPIRPDMVARPQVDEPRPLQLGDIYSVIDEQRVKLWEVGSIVYVVDTEQAEIVRKARRAAAERSYEEYTQRCARRARGEPEPVAKPWRPSYLRLVVDNDSVPGHQTEEIPHD